MPPPFRIYDYLDVLVKNKWGPEGPHFISLDIAINEKSNEKDATDILRKVFGDRFPNGEDANKDISDKTVAPINLGNEDSHFA